MVVQTILKRSVIWVSLGITFLCAQGAHLLFVALERAVDVFLVWRCFSLNFSVNACSHLLIKVCALCDRFLVGIMKLTASLVLYNNDPRQYEEAIRSFLDGGDGTLYVVDNSEEKLVSELFFNPRVYYLRAGDNLGFGRGHNVAIASVGSSSDVHLLLNPDISFKAHVLSQILGFLEARPDVGAVMPRINYPDGSLQRLCKLLPSPLELILRRFIPWPRVRMKINKRYELHDLSQNEPSCVPTLSGCFLLVRTQLLQVLGGFDERFFMYMEDVDLVRRVGDLADTVYLPSVEVVHSYAKGSYRNRKLLGYHLRSAVLYFMKWGWIFDKTRRDRNRAALRHIQRFEKLGRTSS